MNGQKMPEYLNASYEGDDLFTGDQLRAAVAAERERIIALNAPVIEECNTYIANLEAELQFTQKRLADLELSIFQRAL